MSTSLTAKFASSQADLAVERLVRRLALNVLIFLFQWTGRTTVLGTLLLGQTRRRLARRTGTTPHSQGLSLCQ